MRWGDAMDLKFGKNAKALRDAVNSEDESLLRRLYPQNAEMIMLALQAIRAARNLNDVMAYSMFRPHALGADKKDIFSMSVGGRKRLIIKTLDKDGKVMKRVDFSSTCGLVVEVSEHYGD